MEEIAKMLKKIQENLENQKKEMHDMRDSIIEEINKNINEKFCVLETKTELMENKIEDQQKIINRLEQQLKRKNIVFYGVQEIENNQENLENYILGIINETMAISSFQRQEIDSLYRIGKKNNHIRPVVLTVTTTRRKLEIMRHRSSLKGTSIYVNEDFTSKVMKRRKELQKELKERQKKGENVFLKNDQIILKKDRFIKEAQVDQDNPTNKKRKQSKSPDFLSNSNLQHALSKSGKKYKPIQFYLNRASKNTSSE